jgi:hypothetical protein
MMQDDKSFILFLKVGHSSSVVKITLSRASSHSRHNLKTLQIGGATRDYELMCKSRTTYLKNLFAAFS